MAYLPLSNGGSAQIDDEDVAKLQGYSFYAQTSNGKTYAVAYIAGKLTPLAQVIAPAAIGHYTKYLNGDSLDCRKANLQPTRRRSKRTDFSRSARTAAYEGVSYHAAQKKYIARVYEYDGDKRHQVWLGSFSTPEQAAVVRHAYLNPPAELSLQGYNGSTVLNRQTLNDATTEFRKNLVRNRMAPNRKYAVLKAVAAKV